jgi:eukaryotic-like serine/threonine-protein kinase
MQTVVGPSRTLVFSIFEVDPRAAELRKHGVRIKLQDQPFRILSLLLERPGELVTREEIREELWPNHTFVDFDRSLNKAIAKLRSALGDSAECPRFIETIPRHGYRFIVPVALGQHVPAQISAYPRMEQGPAHSTESTEMDFLKIQRPAQLFYSLTEGWGFSLVMAIFVTFVALAGIFSVRKLPFGASSSSVNLRRSVAVLGFQNLSEDSRDAWLSTAFSDWLTTELSAGDQLRTLPAENIARMKAELSLNDTDSLGKESLERIRKNLGTDLVIAGSYASLSVNSASQIRLDLRLLDARTGETLYANSETGSQANLFELVSRAGEKLRASLGIRKITKEEAAEVATALPSSAEAARFYAEGLSRLRVFDALFARDSLLKSIAADPNYALSHAALAMAWAHLGYDHNAADEAKKAFDLSSNLSRADRLLVEGQFRYMSHDWEKAIGIYQALFQFFPDNPDYGLALANSQVKANKWKNALETVAALQTLPAPLRDDPRIGLAEAEAAMPLGDTKRTETSLVSAEQKARASGASLLVAKSMFARAWLFENLGRLDEVDKVAHEARDLYSAAHDQRGVADVETVEAIALMFRGDYYSARQRYQEALAIHQNIGNEHSVAGEFDNLGEISLFLGDVHGALQKFQESLQTYQEVRDDNGVALARIGLGDTLFAEGKLAQAQKMYEESLETCRQNGDRDREAEALMGLGQVLRAKGDLQGAWQGEARAKEVFQEVGNKIPEARAELHLAQLLLDRGGNEEAAKSIGRAEDLLAKTTSPRDDATARILLSQALIASGKLNEARESVSHAIQFAEHSHDLDISLMSKIILSRIDALSENPTQHKEAVKRLNALAQQAKAADFTYAALEARLAAGEMEVRWDDRESGRAHLLALEREASENGFGLIAQKAAARLQAVGRPVSR